MKNIRRQLKKRTRAQDFDELEQAFFGLVQKHNILVKEHRKLEKEVSGQGEQIAAVRNDCEPRYYC